MTATEVLALVSETLNIEVKSILCDRHFNDVDARDIAFTIMREEYIHPDRICAVFDIKNKTLFSNWKWRVYEKLGRNKEFTEKYKRCISKIAEMEVEHEN